MPRRRYSRSGDCPDIRYTVRKATSRHSPDWFRVFDEWLRTSDDTHEWYIVTKEDRQYPVLRSHAQAKSLAQGRADSLNDFWDRMQFDLPATHGTAILEYLTVYNDAVSLLKAAREVPTLSSVASTTVFGKEASGAQLAVQQLAELRAEFEALSAHHWRSLREPYLNLCRLIESEEDGPDAVWHRISNQHLIPRGEQSDITLPEGSVYALTVRDYERVVREQDSYSTHLGAVVIVSPNAEELYDTLPLGPRLNQHIAPAFFWKSSDTDASVSRPSGGGHYCDPQAVYNVAYQRSKLLQNALKRLAAGENPEARALTAYGAHTR